MSTLDLAISPSDLRALAEQSNAWPFEQGQGQRRPPEKEAERRGAVRDRLRALGPAASGTFGEVARTTMVRQPFAC